jgi:hypothetical protein
MKLALAIQRRFEFVLQPSFSVPLQPSSCNIRTFNAPLSPQLLSHPVSAPRPCLTRLGLLKGSFLATSDGRLVNVSGGAASALLLRQVGEWCAYRFTPIQVFPDDTPRPLRYSFDNCRRG